MSERAGRWLIVNADDFGMSRGVNAGIVEAHRRGIVTAASLMPNLPAAEDALGLARQHPVLDLGLHLTLTAGRPLSPPERVPSLVDADGRFLGLAGLVPRLTLGRVSRDQMHRELSAQFEWAIAQGVSPSHLDSHHHVHVHPLVAPIVLDLARQAGVPWVRRPDEGLVPTLRIGGRAPDLARAAAISALAILLRRPIRRRGLRTAAHFRGVGLGFGFSPRSLVQTLSRLPSGVTELMTHPGRADDELARLDWLTTAREVELAALTSAGLRQAIERLSIRLTSFRNVDPDRSYT